MAEVVNDLTPGSMDVNTHGFDPRDVEYLTKRAVPLDFAHREHLRSLSKEDANELRKKYRMSEHSSGGLWIEYTTTMEGESSCARFRFWDPPSKKKKFTSSAGTAIPYIPLATLKIAEDVDVPLFISEGPVKCLALVAAGFLGIGLGGVESGFFDKTHKEKTGEYVLHPLLKKHVRFAGRTVYVVYDANRATNPCVCRGEGNLARVLRAEGAVVRLVSLPLDGDIDGPDDYLAAHGVDSFKRLVDAATLADPVEQAGACTSKDAALALLETLPFVGALHVASAAVQKQIMDDLKSRLKVNRGDVEAAIDRFAAQIKKHTKEHLHDGPSLSSAVTYEDGKRVIFLRNETHEVILEAIESLQGYGNLYSRGAELVNIRPVDGVYSILPIAVDVLTLNHLSKSAIWKKYDPRKKEYVQTTPPRNIGTAVHLWKDWSPHVPYLKGLTHIPLMRADGSILQAGGYDAQMKLFYIPGIKVLPVPDRPTRDQAMAAKQLLLELIVDFPITGSGRSVWLSSILSYVAREMYEGPTPCHIFDANAPRTGKTLLAKLQNIITEGTNLVCQSYPVELEERRKTILSILRDTSRNVLFDNWAQGQEVGDSIFDSLLTSDMYGGRELGVSRALSLPNRNIWMISGVNIAVRGDTVGRVLYCRIHTNLEHPELRDPSTFKYSDVERYAHEHRAELLQAVLIMLRAWAVADRPKTTIQLGSFKGWTDVVCACLEWLGEPSPILSQEEQVESNGGALAGGRDKLWCFLDAFADEYPRGAYLADVVRDLKHSLDRYNKAMRDFDPLGDGGRPVLNHQRLIDAVMDYCRSEGLPRSGVLGTKLAKDRDRPTDGLIVHRKKDSHTKVDFWTVVRTNLICAAKLESDVGISIDDDDDYCGDYGTVAGTVRGLHEESVPATLEPEISTDLDFAVTAGTNFPCCPPEASGKINPGNILISAYVKRAEVNQSPQSPQLPVAQQITAPGLNQGKPNQSPQSPQEAAAPSDQSTEQPIGSVTDSLDTLVRGVAVSATGHSDHIVVSLLSDGNADFFHYLPRMYPALSQYLRSMGLGSVPTNGQSLKAHGSRFLQWEPDTSPRRIAFNVRAVGA